MHEVLLPEITKKLCRLCQQELQISELPPIEFLDEDSIAGGTSFGQFDGNSIQVIKKNRHPIDIMRTLAHELVHWKQMQSDQELDGSDGSKIENDANSYAGIIMRKFGKMYPEYFLESLP
jgi:hypothetical protein